MAGNSENSNIEKDTENYIEGNNVYILGEFDSNISKNVIPNLQKLISSQRKLKNGKIEIYINSCGGNLYILYEILSLLSMAKREGIKIITYNMGKAFSCGSVLSVIGDERKMFKYARNLIHFGFICSFSKNITEVERNSKDQYDYYNDLIQLYKSHSKLTEKQIKEIISSDCKFLTAKECLKYGLIDEIIEC